MRVKQQPPVPGGQQLERHVMKLGVRTHEEPSLGCQFRHRPDEDSCQARGIRAHAVARVDLLQQRIDLAPNRVPSRQPLETRRCPSHDQGIGAGLGQRELEKEFVGCKNTLKVAQRDSRSRSGATTAIEECRGNGGQLFFRVEDLVQKSPAFPAVDGLEQLALQVCNLPLAVAQFLG
ncbi:MAG: hypothetical protein LC799_18575, partial [Actinobacteria bacterium]|nr:hypothetical protein [Actinomycetota bacterium]